MVFPRLIPILLVRSGGLQKSEKFKTWKYVGDVLNAAKIFNAKDVDELVVLDVDATREGRGPDLEMLEVLAGECFMPLAYGGGVASADTARAVMARGVEKVILNAAAWARPELVTEVSSVLGSSSTVVSCDVVRTRKSLERFDYASHSRVAGDLHGSLQRMVDAGAGEIILQSVDRDGTLSGPEPHMLPELGGSLSVPLVYAGGVASIEHAVSAWKAGMSGVAAGAWFVFKGPHRAVLITYPQSDLVGAAFNHIHQS